MKTNLLLLIVLISNIAFSQKAEEPIKIAEIPQELKWVIEPDSFTIDNGCLSIRAGAETNMFYAPHGNFNVSNMPKLLFTPDNDFSLRAKVYTEHKTKWEAAMLVVYINEEYWAKFCFENESPGKNRMVTVVTNQISDDAYSDYVLDDSVYMMIKKEGKQITFSYSTDGLKWIDIRYFRLMNDGDIKVGFSSQSPIGTGLTSVFTDIEYLKTEKK